MMFWILAAVLDAVDDIDHDLRDWIEHNDLEVYGEFEVITEWDVEYYFWRIDSFQMTGHVSL